MERAPWSFQDTTASTSLRACNTMAPSDLVAPRQPKKSDASTEASARSLRRPELTTRSTRSSVPSTSRMVASMLIAADRAASCARSVLTSTPTLPRAVRFTSPLLDPRDDRRAEHEHRRSSCRCQHRSSGAGAPRTRRAGPSSALAVEDDEPGTSPTTCRGRSTRVLREINLPELVVN